jgi:excinuclease ABC subunit B
MDAAIKETDRRRTIQETYNKKHGLTPQTIIKTVKRSSLPASKSKSKIGKYYSYDPSDTLSLEDLPVRERILRMRKEMERAVKNLQFDRALWIREQILALRKEN